VAVEIGAGQREAVRDLFEAAGLEDLRVDTDLGGRPRVVRGRRK
jgi:methylase of polypeptide subunit release factors